MGIKIDPVNLGEWVQTELDNLFAAPKLGYYKCDTSSNNALSLKLNLSLHSSYQ